MIDLPIKRVGVKSLICVGQQELEVLSLLYVFGQFLVPAIFSGIIGDPNRKEQGTTDANGETKKTV